MKNKVIVTGANGFIGAYLCNSLLKNKINVTAMVRKGADVSLLDKAVPLKYCDYTNKKQMTTILSEYHIIIHLAALTRAKDFEALYDTNVGLVGDIVEIVNNSKLCQQLIFMSSQAAVGTSKGKQTVNEKTKETPISWYGQTKYMAEKRVKLCHKNWTIIRPASVYGDGDKDFLVYFKMINRHLSPIPGSKPKYISLIYIEQLAKIILNCVENTNVYGKIIHASDNHIYTIEQFVKTLMKVMNKKCVKFKLSDKFILAVGDIVDFFLNNQKHTPVFNKQKAIELSQDSWILDSTESLKLLKMTMTETLQQNIRKTFLWYKKHKWI